MRPLTAVRYVMGFLWFPEDHPESKRHVCMVSTRIIPNRKCSVVFYYGLQGLFCLDWSFYTDWQGLFCLDTVGFKYSRLRQPSRNRSCSMSRKWESGVEIDCVRFSEKIEQLDACCKLGHRPSELGYHYGTARIYFKNTFY